MTSFPKTFGERRLGPIAALAGLAVFQAASAAVKGPWTVMVVALV